LLLIVLMGIGLGVAGTLWHTESQRAKEAELLYIGEQYRKAIRSYVESPAAAGAAKHFPKKLDDLILDPRQNTLLRHLRRLYPDPLTGKNDWGLIRDESNQQISGVYSKAPGQPRKQQGFGIDQKNFAAAASYADWRFEVVKAKAVPTAPPTQPSPTTQPPLTATPQPKPNQVQVAPVTRP
jgi:type II secretory pathway pseudopilin PulG